MGKAYRIRVGAVEDVERVVALDRAMETLPHWRAADYLAALQPDNCDPGVRGTIRRLFVAEREVEADVVGFAVGMATLMDAETLAELESVGVDEKARRSGVGQALCEAVIAWSQASGAAQLELEVRSRSAGAIALYERLGFFVTGRRAGYYRDPVDDAVLMRLDLTLKGTDAA